jgi:F-type H+-transporting ATPase subunit b
MHRKRMCLCVFLVSVVVLVGVLAVGAFAAEGDQGTSRFKEIWLNVWRVLNFLILAFFLVKLLKEPLGKFFRERRRLIHNRIQQAETASFEAESELKKVEERLGTMEQEIDKVQQLIGEQGEQERNRIIEKARVEAELLLEKAKIDRDFMIRQAKRRLQNEVVETAVSMAFEQVRAAITSADQERLIEDYLRDLQQKASS